MEKTVRRVTSRQLAVFKGRESLEFFQVPGPRRKLGLGIFPSPRNMKKYKRNMDMKEYLGDMKKMS